MKAFSDPADTHTHIWTMYSTLATPMPLASAPPAPLC
jgi:hypothetical protein